MRVERRTSEAKEVLADMIVSDPVAAAVSARWDGKGLFGVRHLDLVGGWVVKHYRKYRKAPGRLIESIFDRWSENGRHDPETAKLVESILSGLSAEYVRRKKSVDPAFAVDRAARLFNLNRLRQFKDELEGLVEAGELEKAEELRRGFSRVEFGSGSIVSVTKSGESVQDAFEHRGEVLVDWNDECLNRFFDSAFEREGFVMFVGAPKRGKSFWLQEVAWRATEQSRNVAFFEVGDQSQRQILRRFGARAAGRPIKAERNVRIPTAIRPGDPSPEVDYESDSWDEPLAWQAADRALRKLGGRVGEDRLRLSVHPNKSVTAEGIESILEDWARADWHPDLIVVDYTTLLAPINKNDVLRDQINANNEVLRRVSQSLRCCVVSAVQANRKGHDAKVLRMSDLSDDIRIAAHVTALVGINRTEREKEKGLCRLNMMNGRDLDFTEDRELWVAGCAALANPAICSCF